MPTSTKPRKKYRPKPRLGNPMAWLLEGFSPLAQQSEYMLNLRLQNTNALDMLTRGIAKASHMNVLLAASNATQALMHLGIGAEYEAVAENGYTALKGLGERGAQMGRFVCRGPEIGHIKGLMELHDAQLAVTTLERLERAIEICKAKTLPRLFHFSIQDRANELLRPRLSSRA